MERKVDAVERPSYTIVRHIDGALSQLVRLISHGYYFIFYEELTEDKDPKKLDEKLIDIWELEKPPWKREARRRGKAPSIWYLRYRQHYFLLSTRGRSVAKNREGEPHPFFEEYPTTNVQRKALTFCGYSIRYPRSHVSGKHELRVSLDDRTYDYVKDTILLKAINQRYQKREAIEAEFARLPYQPYAGVQRQLHGILEQVNKRRSRYVGFEPARKDCIPSRMRVVRVYDRAA